MRFMFFYFVWAVLMNGVVRLPSAAASGLDGCYQLLLGTPAPPRPWGQVRKHFPRADAWLKQSDSREFKQFARKHRTPYDPQDGRELRPLVENAIRLLENTQLSLEDVGKAVGVPLVNFTDKPLKDASGSDTNYRLLELPILFTGLYQPNPETHPFEFEDPLWAIEKAKGVEGQDWNKKVYKGVRLLIPGTGSEDSDGYSISSLGVSFLKAKQGKMNKVFRPELGDAKVKVTYYEPTSRGKSRRVDKHYVVFGDRWYTYIFDPPGGAGLGANAPGWFLSPAGVMLSTRLVHLILDRIHKGEFFSIWGRSQGRLVAKAYGHLYGPETGLHHVAGVSGSPVSREGVISSMLIGEAGLLDSSSNMLNVDGKKDSAKKFKICDRTWSACYLDNEEYALYMQGNSKVPSLDIFSEYDPTYLFEYEGINYYRSEMELWSEQGSNNFIYEVKGQGEHNLFRQETPYYKEVMEKLTRFSSPEAYKRREKIERGN